MKLMQLFIFAAPLCLLTGCGQLFGINLTVVGEKTALEQQVLGAYQELGQDLAVYASVRAVAEDGSLKEPVPRTESQADVLQAINNRRYNRDDLEQLLTAQVVGEGNTGLLVQRSEVDSLPEDLTPDLVAEVIQEENRDRETILARLMTTTPGVTESDRGEVGWILATLNQDLAPQGTLLQQRDGTWREK